LAPNSVPENLTSRGTCAGEIGAAETDAVGVATLGSCDQAGGITHAQTQSKINQMPLRIVFTELLLVVVKPRTSRVFAFVPASWMTAITHITKAGILPDCAAYAIHHLSTFSQFAINR
jgi:hypothetical protein